MGKHLPFDPIAEVLARLPTKSLMRFKTISHPWNNLISHPWFINFRNHYYKRTLRILYVKSSENGECKFHCTMTDTEGKLIKEFTLPAITNSFGSGQWLYPSRFDLACFHTTNGQIYLCNPNTQEILPLPYMSPYTCRVSCIGFGYSSKTHEYKVVSMFLENPTFYDQYGLINDIACQIYSLGEEGAHSNNSWKTIAEKCPHPVMGPAACVDEVLHWMTSDDYHEPRVAIVSFDLSTENFTTMPISQQWIDICVIQVYAYVRELGGKLCLVYPSGGIEFEDKVMGIWMVKEHNEGTWEKWLQINLNDVENASIYTGYESVPTGYIENEEEILLLTFGINDGRLNYYNTQAKIIRTIKECNKPPFALFCLCWESRVFTKWAGQWLT